MRCARIKAAWRSAKGRQSRKLARAARMKADKADKADKTDKAGKSVSRGKPHAGRARSKKANKGVRTWIGSWTTADRFIRS